ncbi:rRNA methyltransferase [Hamiltosporidium tvaerminnensis]|uniref:rRNA methyltransferase n=1 Tax=Hamiltosporidium tvaerminnensis TaxID=1176355 RepID=A0A4Q9KZS5_9MICR|nr:tRNA (cytosine-5-)-methyltransferase ncl1 [Hamiltosporidium tvaerminnensis]TBU00553.1 rRNA methyltransferase [Hamiltosporidium tvaerminnensis]
MTIISKSFINFYKKNLALENEDFEEFLTFIEKPLPITFRLNTMSSSYHRLRDIVLNISLLKEILPNVFSLQISKNELRKNIKEMNLGENNKFGVENKFGEENNLKENKLEEENNFKEENNKLGEELNYEKNIKNMNIKDKNIEEEYKKLKDILVVQSEVGNLYRQELVSMLPVLIIQPTVNSKVLDMCAAPGSKSSQILEFVAKNWYENSRILKNKNFVKIFKLEENKGIVILNDVRPNRINILMKRIEHLQLPSTVVTQCDARYFPNLPFKFDIIYCDVPCGGDGTIRKCAELWKDWSVNTIFSMTKLQMQIVEKGLQLLENGGIFVYSTCSLNPYENEFVIQQILETKEFEIIDCSEKLKELNIKYRPGLTEWYPEGYLKPLDSPDTFMSKNNPELKKCIRIYPHDQNTNGFFICVLKKISNFTKQNLNKKTKKATNFDFLTEIQTTEIQNICDSNKIENIFSKNTKDLIFVSETLKEFLKNIPSNLKIISAGTHAFTSFHNTYRIKPSVLKYRYLNHLSPHQISKTDALKLINNRSFDLEELQKKNIPKKNIILQYKEFLFCCWIGENKISVFVGKKEKESVLQLIEMSENLNLK